ncbi:MAG: TetR-like C-terminal domain-containing protein [Micropruina sp.]|uniref:TetR/AcrR family transcriptional regulator n=1 Tax=Micropruina sp. TaxID=2737536 RepID=UPI0039E6D53C
MGRPREHDENTRAALLAAAAHLVDEEGIGALSARRLAAEVGTTTRAIYSVFDGMDGVLSELFRAGAEDMVARHEAIRVQPDGADEILPLALAYRAAALARPESYGLIYERSVPTYRPPEELLALMWRCMARVMDAVRRALALRDLDVRAAERITKGLWATVHGHAALELRGLLGSPRAAERIWRESILARVAQTFP